MTKDLSIGQSACEGSTGTCPPRDGFAVANLFSAKGALSSLAWGNRPRHSVTSATPKAFGAEGAIQFEGEDRACCRK